MPPKTICLDAGLVIRRVFFPDDSSTSQAWETWENQGCHCAAPTLLPYEVTNVLHRYAQQGLLSQDTALVALMAALALPVELVGDPALHQRALELDHRYLLPAAYDAHYLALAERLGCPLWTANARLVSALRSQGVGWLRLVGLDDPATSSLLPDMR